MLCNPVDLRSPHTSAQGRRGRSEAGRGESAKLTGILRCVGGTNLTEYLCSRSFEKRTMLSLEPTQCALISRCREDLAPRRGKRGLETRVIVGKARNSMFLAAAG